MQIWGVGIPGGTFCWWIWSFLPSREEFLFMEGSPCLVIFEILILGLGVRNIPFSIAGTLDDAVPRALRYRIVFDKSEIRLMSMFL